jgi:antitoxin YefM
LFHCPYFITLYTTTQEAQHNFAAWCASAIDDREIIVMQHKKDQNVALIAADELESLLETSYLLRSPANAERLLTALRRAEAQTEESETVQELRASVGL